MLTLRDNAERLSRAGGLHVLPTATTWIPPEDPHRDRLATLAVA